VGFYPTSPAPAKGDPTPKNRVWRFFRDRSGTRPANRVRAPQPRREIGPTPTRTAPGLSCWPSRDPIGERGGLNLYGFVDNRGVNWWDSLGMTGFTGGLYVGYDESQNPSNVRPKPERNMVTLRQTIEKHRDRLEAELKKLCPSEGAVIATGSARGVAPQCCRRDSCLEQATELSYSIAEEVFRYSSLQMLTTGDATASIGHDINLNLTGGDNYPWDGCDGRGLKCTGWAELVSTTVTNALDPYIADEILCFRALEVGKGMTIKGARYFNHSWVTLHGPHVADEPTLKNIDAHIDPFRAEGWGFIEKVGWINDLGYFKAATPTSLDITIIPK